MPVAGLNFDEPGPGIAAKNDDAVSFHVPPRCPLRPGKYQSQFTVPMSIVFNRPSAKNKMDRLSGDQNGSVPFSPSRPASCASNVIQCSQDPQRRFAGTSRHEDELTTIRRDGELEDGTDARGTADEACIGRRMHGEPNRPPPATVGWRVDQPMTATSADDRRESPPNAAGSPLVGSGGPTRARVVLAGIRGQSTAIRARCRQRTASALRDPWRGKPSRHARAPPG